MTNSKAFNLAIIFAAIFVALFAAPVAAQRRKRPAPVTTATAAQRSIATPPAGALAIVNGRAITLADIDSRASGLVASQDQMIADARRTALDVEVATLLLEAEAKQRNKTVGQLLDAEVNAYVVSPGEEEIKSVYEANPAQFGATGLANARMGIINLIRKERADPLYKDLIARLRASHKVVLGADVNSTARLAPSSVLATVDGRVIKSGAVSERAKPMIYKLKLNAYEVERAALEFKISSMLLESEAARQQKTPDEIFRQEVVSKIRRPADIDVQKFYEQNKAHLDGDLASQRAVITAYLEQQEQSRLEAEFAQKLRAGANVKVFLTEPEAPVQVISTDDDPSRGDARAPVTVVVFTDFQCPACAVMHPLIEEAIRAYGNRVRLVVRDFPLPMHGFARKAAEAAAAANAQGKFFEYTALLYKNQPNLDVPALKRIATEIGLDRARFDAALDGGVYAAEVERDIADGELYGIDSTPTIFVNGVRVNLRELKSDIVRAAIDRALARVRTTQPGNGAYQTTKRATK